MSKKEKMEFLLPCKFQTTLFSNPDPRKCGDAIAAPVLLQVNNDNSAKVPESDTLLTSLPVSWWVL